MPDVCPTYYWLDLQAASETFGALLREPSFLRNPRLPRGVADDRATLQLCTHGRAACASSHV